MIGNITYDAIWKTVIGKTLLTFCPQLFNKHAVPAKIINKIFLITLLLRFSDVISFR